MAVWLITGCSTGLGRALAEEAIAAGHSVVATARDVSSLDDVVQADPDRVLAVRLDVTSPSDVDAAVAAALDRFGRIDVLVNNAGYGYRAAVEEGDEAQVATLFDTHFFGPVRLIKAVLPSMRERRSGAIVNLSSIGARRSFEGSGYYSAVKSAIEGLTSSLRKEVEPLGITAMAVEPGGFRTDFSGRSLTEAPTEISDYAETAGRRRKRFSESGTQPGDPAKAARAIITAVESDHTPELLVLGPDAVAGFRAVLEAQLESLETWRALSESTDVD